MKTFNIVCPDEAIRQRLEFKNNDLTKPKGALGRLEDIAIQLGMIQQTLTPRLKNPHNILFAGDHGAAEENISKSPKEITWQVLYNFIEGGQGINFLCRQHGFVLDIVDVGVDHDFEAEMPIIHRKIAYGTKNYCREAAMSENELEKALEIGAERVKTAFKKGCNIVSFGEMGITNTSASAIWMSFFTGIDLKECVGAGSGLDEKGIRHKYQVLKKAMESYPGDCSAWDIIRYFGGFEMVAAVGGMMQAAELKMVVLVDGFIMTACMLAASKIYPDILHYAIFGHSGEETGHRQMLAYLDAEPVLELGMHLGEGSGAVCAFPIIDSAARMFCEMKTFHGADMTKYFE